MVEARPGSFHHRYYERTRRGRLRKDIITFEEAIWLIIGLFFGWFVGHGATVLLLLVPAVLFVVWVYEYIYAKKYGVRTVHGKLQRE